MEFNRPDSSLIHWGIKGMRWGVRRYENPDGTLTEAGKERYRKNQEKIERKAIKKQRKLDNKNRSTLNDAELNKKIDRLRKEKELRTLTESEVTRGKGLVKDAMKNVGSKVLTTVGAGLALYGAKSIASGRFDRNELGNALFQGGPKKK